MVLSTVFSLILAVLRQAHLYMLSWSAFHQYFTQYSFQATGCFPTTIVEKMDSGERGINLIAMIIVRPWREYWLSHGSNQRPPVLKPRTLPLRWKLRTTARIKGSDVRV